MTNMSLIECNVVAKKLHNELWSLMELEQESNHISLVRSKVLSFDRSGNLYVVDVRDYPIQKIEIDQYVKFPNM
jgi:hypothetical protein